MSDDPPAWRDHDHSVEDAFLDYVGDPTEASEHAAELAIATLQRRFDHLLRRLDGDGTPPPYPVHHHNAADNPADCLDAVMFELAGAQLADRAETLAHGLEAMRELLRQVAEARTWARSYRHEQVDADDPPAWLTSDVPPE